MAKKEKWDGRSRPSNKAYDEGYARIFNPVAKELRTSKYKSQVIKNKKKEDPFDSKSTAELLDEVEIDEEYLKELKDKL